MDKELTEATKYLQECRKRYGSDDLRTKSAFAARKAELQATTKPLPGIWYLSFANETTFLGGMFLYATSTIDAVQRAHDMGMNPGGEVLACPPNESTAETPDRFMDRLMSKAELEEMSAQASAGNN